MRAGRVYSAKTLPPDYHHVAGREVVGNGEERSALLYRRRTPHVVVLPP
jgi:hypothetical protein